MHHFFDVQLDACPLMRMQRQPNPPAPSSRFHTKGADLLLLPVACADGITVGYSFGSMRSATPSQTRNGAFCGRFAFEIQREELVVISNGDQPGIPEHVDKLMVIMSFLWTPQAVREHYMILCPMQEYSFYNLPNEVLFFSSAEMHTPSKQSAPPDIQALQSLFSTEDSLDVIDELLLNSPSTALSPECSTSPFDDPENLLPLQPASSDLPWFLDSNGKPTDNVGIPRHPGDLQTSSGVFNMNALAASLSSIEKSIRGDFYGSRQVTDITHPETRAHPLKISAMPSARNVVARISRSNAFHGGSLRELAVHLYLSDILPVVSDQRFLGQSRWAGINSTRGTGDKTRNQEYRRRAPKIAPLPKAPVSGESETRGLPEDDEDRKREEKREAKRRRNRLSAARSNEKRKENWQKQRQTLESLRKKVQELEQRKLTLSAENEQLKDRAFAILK